MYNIVLLFPLYLLQNMRIQIIYISIFTMLLITSLLTACPHGITPLDFIKKHMVSHIIIIEVS